MADETNCDLAQFDHPYLTLPSLVNSADADAPPPYFYLYSWHCL